MSFLAYIPIKNHYVKREYSLTSSKLPKVSNLPQTLIENIIKSWQHIRDDLGSSLIFLLTVFLLVLLFATIVIQNIINNLNKKQFTYLIFSLLLVIFYYFILICSFIFPSLILASPPFSPRIFIGFTAVIGIGCLFLAHFQCFSQISWLKYVLIFYLSLIILSFANLSLTYGNVLYHQDIYEQRIGTLIIADIEKANEKLFLPSELPKISFVNSDKVRNVRTNAVNRKALEKYPILNELAPTSFNPNNFVKFVTFGLNFEPQFSEKFIDKNKGYYIPTNEPIISRQLYNIYLENEDTFIIVFKE